MDTDVVVIGGGSAGLQAALTLGRMRFDVVVVDAGAPSNALAHAIGGLLGAHNLSPTLQVARELERIALSDEYFISRKLYPNVDFYSGIILDAIGFPTSMFTAIFALSRTVGWIAQWKEMIADPQKKIGRPRQLYQGAAERDYVPVSSR